MFYIVNFYNSFVYLIFYRLSYYVSTYIITEYIPLILIVSFSKLFCVEYEHIAQVKPVAFKFE